MMKVFKNIFRKYPLLILSAGTGLLLSLSWPAGGVPLISFIAFIPLLTAEELVLENKSRYHRFTVLLYAWLAFIIFNGLTTWWIFYASFPGVIMAVFLNSLFMAIPFALMHGARRVLPGKQGIFSLLIFWITFEYLHLDWDLSWSWLNLGNVFATMPRFIQWYEYTGTLGGTAWVLIMNICFFSLLKLQRIPVQTIEVERVMDTAEAEKKKKMELVLKNRQQYQLLKKKSITGFITLLLLIGPFLVSVWIWNRYESPYDPVEVVIIQPGRDPYLNPANSNQAREWVDSMIILANSKLTAESRFVVAPEGALPSGLWLHSMEKHYGFLTLSGHAALFDTLTWVSGVMMFEQYDNKGDISETARLMPESDFFYDVFNAALMVDSRGNVERYYKSKLVPGVERMPFARYMKFMGDLVEKFGGTSGSLGIQKERSVFTGADGTRIAPVICYESIYGEYLNEYVARGAQLIFIITNDGWWRNTPGHKQHFQYARLRAIETRRSIARAASTGISGFFNQRGEVIQQSSWWQPVALKETLHRNEKRTFYVRNGDYIGRLSLFLTILLILYMISQMIIGNKRIGTK